MEGQGDLTVEAVVGVEGGPASVVDELDQPSVGVEEADGADGGVAVGLEGRAVFGRPGLAAATEVLDGLDGPPGGVIDGNGGVALGVDDDGAVGRADAGGTLPAHPRVTRW